MVNKSGYTVVATTHAVDVTTNNQQDHVWQILENMRSTLGYDHDDEPESESDVDWDD